ncbi:hypothetical protein HHX38_20105 [Streptomyces sp. PKU-MA01144]|uniref:AMIN-like domain-containing (lipo)protein n=1 Tax=Streptomyces sp. PKU-MA01144 TaxID=2729138 RepID=UPI001480B42B|nr:hypothetical protein [Streptomyces sp. PKU-MA01144]NNJ06415.1 hypothetical protein [Streptomyces sp. PKU-MA01144]
MYRRPRLAAVAAGVLLTAGVGSTVPASAAPPRTTATEAAPATTLVTNARWGGHGSFDRFVIDLRGAQPHASVRPVKALRYDGTGHKVPLAGKHFLEVRLSPAAAHDDAGRSVYRGPKLLKIHLPTLKGLAMTGDFEGYVTFGAAFDSKPVYKTTRLHAPERIVIDVRRGPAGCGA